MMDEKRGLSRRMVIGGGLAAAAALSLPMLDDEAEADTLSHFEPLPPGTRIDAPDFDSRGPDGESFKAGVRPTRPMAGIRMERQVIGSGAARKVIIHHYGHGGAGITLSWGSAKRAVGLIETAVREVMAAGETPRIVILGAGIIGMTTARELVDRWQRDWPALRLTVRAKAFRDTTSFVAAGQFEPSVVFRDYYRLGRTDELKGILRDSHNKLLDFGRDKRQRYGIRRRRNFAIMRTIDAFDARYMPPEVVGPPRRWTSLPINGLSDLSGYEYETWLVNPTVLLPILREELTAEGVVFRIGDSRVVSRAEIPALDSNIIVNCTGIGSKLLFDDAALEGRRGHVIKLNNPRNLRYFLSAGCNEGMADMPNYRSAYIFARQDDVIVGGSWTSDFDPANPVRVDPVQCREILARVRGIMAGRTDCVPVGPR
ncbi:MAG: FAD-dependent oxidoreductase [Hyphomicrobiaceae bacterium]